jgi:hypothetical protein
MASAEEEENDKEGPSLIQGGGNCQVGIEMADLVGSRSKVGYLGEVH